MKILILSSTFPYPPTRGGTQVRTFNLLKHLSKNHEITIMTRPNSDVSRTDIEALERLVKEVKIFPYSNAPNPSILGKINRFYDFIMQGTPPNVRQVYSADIQFWLDRAIDSQKFDVITCEHSVNEIFVRPHWQKKLKTIINIHSLAYKTCKNQLEIGVSPNPIRDTLYLPLLERYERRFCQKFNAIVVTTSEDKEQMEELNINRPVIVIPNGVDLEMFPYRETDPSGYQIIMTGGLDYSSNIDAVRFFSLEVFPILQQKYPEVTLILVGSNPAPSVIELTKNSKITVTGRVPSMAKYLHHATICVVAMRSGFGIKNKTLESMAAGVPVVASDRGLEGLTVEGNNVPLAALRANSIDEYCTAISSLFESAELREKLSRNARKLIEDNYTWQQAAGKYEQVLTADIC